MSEATTVVLSPPQATAEDPRLLPASTVAVGAVATTSTSARPAIAVPKVRNQAPGIPDRRKSLRPNNVRASRGSRKSSGAPATARLSMIDMASEMRLKDGEDDDGDKTDTFEDAESTPTTTSPEPDANRNASSEVNVTPNTEVKEESAQETDGAGNNEQPIRIETPDSDDQSTATMPTIADAEETTAEEDVEAAEQVQQSQSQQTILDSVQLPPPDKKPSPAPSVRDRSLSPGKSRPDSRQRSPIRTMQGLSGDLPVISQPPPSSAARRQALERQSTEPLSAPPQPGNLARKASSGFGALLGRMNSIRKPARSPSAPRQESRFNERRGTGASLASMDGSHLSGVHDGVKLSLQDQFSNLRRQEEYSTHEANVHTPEEQDKRSEKAQSDAGVRTSISPTREERSGSTTALKSPSLNPSLPPGTASGMSAGPTTEPSEVNWDLWSKLVYEGPAAVARASGEQLNQAITSGIPSIIRGVVWQVLAESKNEELENVYRTLKARGTESENRPLPSQPGSGIAPNGSAIDRDGATSDASSEHSDRSTTANSGIASPPTSVSVESSGPELRSKLLEEKQKRESVALQKLEKAIKRDMGTRTSYSKYAQARELQDGLFGVCKAYALFDEGVGYAQGINFIAMPLLFNLPEEEAFTLLVRLMSKYDLRSLFTADMPGLHLRLYQFERLLEDYEPAVYCHMRRLNVGPQLYATQWFLTLFAYRFPLQLVLRIYDLILSEGLTAILKFGIVLMQRNRATLLEMKDMSHLTNFLKEKLFDVYIDKSPSASSLLDSGFFGSVSGGADKELYRADDMVRDACNIKVSDEVLARYTVEWEEKQRADRERDNELETLRTANITLTAKVKALEERVQQHDSEHVNIAQDLVKVKIENNDLLDENEGLKLKVGELQKMVDAQPAEVEEKLKQEMERIMQRNIEVQNENRNLKEEMDEMEHELVNSKMAHAQTQADHDSIKQKWSSVQALLNEKS